jgi:hypothetical protein
LLLACFYLINAGQSVNFFGWWIFIFKNLPSNFGENLVVDSKISPFDEQNRNITVTVLFF